MTELLGSIGDKIVRDVAVDRGLSAPKVREIMNVAPLLPLLALKHKLVDGIKYRDEVHNLFQRISTGALDIKGAKSEGGQTGSSSDSEQLPRMTISKYMATQDAKELVESSSWSIFWPWEGFSQLWKQIRDEKTVEVNEVMKKREEVIAATYPAGAKVMPRVALLHARGMIVQGPVHKGGLGPPNQQSAVVDATALAAELSKIEKDPLVRAVVLRVSSPGGSALGSDTIHHALIKLRKAGKKVVVSMGDVAASGGMFIASAADKIVAQSSTITGSIGVVVGKFNVAPLLQEVGVNTDRVSVGENVNMLGSFSDLTPDQEKQVNALMDHIYVDFLCKVAVGRNKKFQETRALAKGKVYTGEQALKINLIDQLGGLVTAIEVAKREAGLLGLPSSGVAIIEYPPHRVPLILRIIKATGLGRGSSTSGADDDESLSLSASWLLPSTAELAGPPVITGAWLAGLLFGGNASGGVKDYGAASALRGTMLPHYECGRLDLSPLLSLVYTAALHQEAGPNLVSLDALLLAQSLK
ncbi:hypothetical protein CEUSTIGMA_g8414.t1 [Chlamydomonas eustigma]|uniref:Peptidase S49 domain-containing protein n=1 Tax=Chlamydomonas eustigma TaxID=1157962 RepID=A0A250XDJ0_9CHLO|nr:hypothetical protein CEUSTIGMA_g8414.t1 [Chlamydomonas eustigma]|eukprot:GAX80979.1 hypothetical protein CEUSTIGMA_g8414.t1 [Chlamydomonas eustigma]